MTSCLVEMTNLIRLVCNKRRAFSCGAATLKLGSESANPRACAGQNYFSLTASCGVAAAATTY